MICSFLNDHSVVSVGSDVRLLFMVKFKMFEVLNRAFVQADRQH